MRPPDYAYMGPAIPAKSSNQLAESAVETLPPPVIVAPAQHAPETTQRPLILGTNRPARAGIAHRKEGSAFADCNHREPGGILGAGEHLAWEIAMAVKIDRIQPAGMNVRR